MMRSRSALGTLVAFFKSSLTRRRLESSDSELSLKLKQVRDEISLLTEGDVSDEFDRLQERLQADREAVAGMEQALQQQAPGLRISKAAAHAGGGLPPPPSVPSNRSEAVRLAELLTDLIATRGGTWEELWRVHDAALAELVLQVGVHCAERGELLQRIRKFFGSALRWSRNGDAAKQA